jgi:hypothetical protein
VLIETPQIRLTGVGIPLNELIEKSGLELKPKPRYYQGLTVGGRKRADWARAPGGPIRVVEDNIPPLLHVCPFSEPLPKRDRIANIYLL